MFICYSHLILPWTELEGICFFLNTYYLYVTNAPSAVYLNWSLGKDLFPTHSFAICPIMKFINPYCCFPSYLVFWHTPLARHFLYILPLTSSLVSIRIYLSLFPPLKKSFILLFECSVKISPPLWTILMLPVNLLILSSQ